MTFDLKKKAKIMSVFRLSETWNNLLAMCFIIKVDKTKYLKIKDII